MKRIILLALIAIVVIAIDACKKDPSLVHEPLVHEATPYNINIPGFVTNLLGEMKQPADNPLTVEGVALGRKLFYDKMLSNDGTMACATCHKQENGFDDPRPFSQGTNGIFGNRNAMAIINLGWGDKFFWDGRRSSLEEQAHDPVTNPIEMATTWPDVVNRLQANSSYPELFFKAFGSRTIDSNMVTKAIAQFERTLVSFNSRFDKYYYMQDSAALTASEIAGLQLFTTKAFCNKCHLVNTLFTDGNIVNNGLDMSPEDPGLMKFTNDPKDRGKFKVPTLRNIAVTAPYMHDSRFETLEQVVEYYNRFVVQSSPNIDHHMKDFGNGLNLTIQEKADLVAFLKSLTDDEFLKNPDFSEPK